jgi:hypothetical protein
VEIVWLINDSVNKENTSRYCHNKYDHLHREKMGLRVRT